MPKHGATFELSPVGILQIRRNIFICNKTFGYISYRSCWKWFPFICSHVSARRVEY